MEHKEMINKAYTDLNKKLSETLQKAQVLNKKSKHLHCYDMVEKIKIKSELKDMNKIADKLGEELKNLDKKLGKQSKKGCPIKIRK